jgi:hypothetical protein
MHAHPHLACAGLVLGQVQDLQNFGATELKKSYSAHGVILGCSKSVFETGLRQSWRCASGDRFLKWTTFTST